MRIAAAVRVTVRGPEARAAHIEHGDRERGVDVRTFPTTDGARNALSEGGLGQKPIEPRIEVEADPHHHARILQPRHVLRLGLILLGVEIGRNEAGHRDALTANCASKARQIGRRGDNVQTLLGTARAGERECEDDQHRQAHPHAMETSLAKSQMMAQGPRAAPVRVISALATGSWPTGSAQICRSRRSRRPDNPSPRSPAHRHRAAPPSSRTPAI
jgi:hypothetical protein